MSGIFICYRREDSGGYAGRLYDHLVRHVGKGQIFMDIDAIPVGQNFVDVIDQRIGSCDVLIALIGITWMNATNRRGQRRLDDPADFVRLEIEAAFKRKIPIIPVLVGGARMPAAQELPGEIAHLAYLNAFEIYDRMFDESIARLVAILNPPWKVRIQRWVNASLRYATEHPVVFAFTAIFLLIFLIALSLNTRGVRSVDIKSANRSVDRASVPVGSIGKEKSDIQYADLVPVRIPGRITRSPAVVEAARTVFLSDDFRKAIGPRQPKVAWRAGFQRQLNEFIGVAEDGTLYFGNNESAGLLAVREGRELWAYNFSQRGRSRFSVAPDGSIWNQETDYSTNSQERERFFIYNSRGEGGLITGKIGNRPENTNRYPDFHGYGTSRGETVKGIWYEYDDCDLKSVSGSFPDSRGDIKRSTVHLDGHCASNARAVDDDADLILMTDVGTLYCINRQGRVLWTRKVTCPLTFLAPLDASYLVYGCGNTLHALRSGSSQWDFTLDVGSDPKYVWQDFDKSGTLYLMEGSSLLAVDDNGQLLWKLPADGRPLALDQRGRLYVATSSTITCFSN